MNTKILPHTALNLSLVASAIKSGAIVAFPTDTLYALSCLATDDKAVSKLIAIKRRDALKTLPILVSNIQMAERYVQFSQKAMEIATSYWPGALTIVLPAIAGSGLSNACIRDGMVAVRMPAQESALKVIEEVGYPVVGTSANISGESPRISPSEIMGDLGDEIALILDDSVDVSAAGLPSTIVKVEGSEVVLLRDGALKIC